MDVTENPVPGNETANSQQVVAQENDPLIDSIEQIDQTITGRYIRGKFKGPVVLHEQQVLPEDFNRSLASDYVIVPNIKYRDLDPTGQFDAVGEMVRSGVSRGGFQAKELEKLWPILILCLI